MYPGMEDWKTFFTNHSNAVMRKISETMIWSKSTEQYDYITKQLALKAGTHATLFSHMSQEELDWGQEYNNKRGWYRSKDIMPGDYPYTGFLTDKKWILNEEVTQVT